MPPGTVRTGFTTNLVINRLDFGVGAENPALGNDVHTMISFEAVRK
jgi:polyisoprenoid-binding protein YceI